MNRLHAEMHLAMAAVDASTDRHAPEMKNPLTANREILWWRARNLFMDHCAGCHGLPSNPDSQFGRSFYPPVPQFFKEGSDMAENQNFYIIQHGIRWSGMPAWSRHAERHANMADRHVSEQHRKTSAAGAEGARAFADHGSGCPRPAPAATKR